MKIKMTMTRHEEKRLEKRYNDRFLIKEALKLPDYEAVEERLKGKRIRLRQIRECGRRDVVRFKRLWTDLMEAEGLA